MSVARSIFDVAAGIRSGITLREANAALVELVQTVRETGKAGTLTFTMKVEPDKTDENLLAITPDFSVKMPKKPRGHGLYYATTDGGLTKEDPRQIDAFAENEKVATIEQAAQEGRLSRIGRGND